MRIEEGWQFDRAKSTSTLCKANEPVEYRFCQLTPALVALLLLASLGISLILPGALMRLELVPVATPVPLLHLCSDVDGTTLRATSETCTSKSATEYTPSVLKLSSTSIVAGVEYVPVLVLPGEPIVTGRVALSVWSLDERLLSSTQTFGSNNVPMPNYAVNPSYLAGTYINVSAQYPVDLPPELQACPSTEKCLFQLHEAYKEVVFTSSRFIASIMTDKVIDTSNDYSVPLVFASNLTVQIDELQLSSSSRPFTSDDAFYVFLSFHQSSLTGAQTQGVHLIIIGSAFCLCAMALLFICFLNERKKDHNH